MVDAAQRPPTGAPPILESPLAEPYVEAVGVPSARLSRGALAWALYEGVRDPYVILITIYVFMPYFATVMVGDPVTGQSLVARITTLYGLVAAAACPLFGAALDRLGPRKPLLALVTGLMVVLIGALWFAKPDGSGLSVAAVSWMVGGIGLLFAFSEVLHNSLLPHATRPEQTAAASGLGLALGNAFAVVMLVFVLWAFALPGKLSLPLLPAQPLFGLSVASHETDRIVGPIVAVMFALGAIPLFLLCRDAPRGLGGGLSGSFKQLLGTLGALRTDRRMALFLGSRMIYTDGMTSILVFSGVLAAGVMGWKVLDLLAFGVVMSAAATAGGFLATWLDGQVGAKRAIQIQLATVIVCEALLLGMAPHRLFYMPYSGGPVWNGPVFRTVPELAFLVLGSINALGVCGSYASSRVMLTRLCTPDRVAGWFGLYALSGSVTVWLGSALVSFFTRAFGSQQAGFIPIAALLILGLIGLSFVKGRARVGDA